MVRDRAKVALVSLAAIVASACTRPIVESGVPQAPSLLNKVHSAWYIDHRVSFEATVRFSDEQESILPLTQENIDVYILTEQKAAYIAKLQTAADAIARMDISEASDKKTVEEAQRVVREALALDRPQMEEVQLSDRVLYYTANEPIVLGAQSVEPRAMEVSPLLYPLLDLKSDLSGVARISFMEHEEASPAIVVEHFYGLSVDYVNTINTHIGEHDIGSLDGAYTGAFRREPHTKIIDYPPYGLGASTSSERDMLVADATVQDTLCVYNAKGRIPEEGQEPECIRFNIPYADTNYLSVLETEVIGERLGDLGFVTHENLAVYFAVLDEASQLYARTINDIRDLYVGAIGTRTHQFADQELSLNGKTEELLDELRGRDTHYSYLLGELEK